MKVLNVAPLENKNTSCMCFGWLEIDTYSILRNISKYTKQSQGCSRRVSIHLLANVFMNVRPVETPATFDWRSSLIGGPLLWKKRKRRRKRNKTLLTLKVALLPPCLFLLNPVKVNCRKQISSVLAASHFVDRLYIFFALWS